MPKNFKAASTKDKKASPITLIILNATSPIPPKPSKNEAKSPSNILSIFDTLSNALPINSIKFSMSGKKSSFRDVNAALKPFTILLTIGFKSSLNLSKFNDGN